MAAQWILFSYLMAALAALLVLFAFGPVAWYFHVIGILAGLLAGLVPPPSGNGGDLFYIVTGTACVFLLLWGIGGILYLPLHRKRSRLAFSSSAKLTRSHPA
jgi:hypothetical protein